MSAAPEQESSLVHDPYALLVGLAERERELVADGRLDELVELARRREELTAGLPPEPPPSARRLLERASALQQETSAALENAMRVAELELRRLERGRGAVRGYAPPAEPRTAALINQAG